MSRFPTPEARVLGRGNTYAKRIAVLAACATANTDTFLGERFRRHRPCLRAG
jgi:hypothetical protein